MVMMAKKVTKRPVSKGFGAQKEIKGSCVELKDAKTVNLMDWLKSGGASVSKVAIADFKGLRGVAGVSSDRLHPQSLLPCLNSDDLFLRHVFPLVARPPARQVIEAGEAVVSIPQELALQLGTDGVNPGYAAVNLCRINKSEERRAAGWFQPFLDVLPSNEQCDTTDFFSEEELAALEWDPVVEETRERLKMLRSTYDASQIAGIDKEHQPFSWDEFLWGVYQVVSRVLTIYTDSQGGQKYLIPVRIKNRMESPG